MRAVGLTLASCVCLVACEDLEPRTKVTRDMFGEDWPFATIEQPSRCRRSGCGL